MWFQKISKPSPRKDLEFSWGWWGGGGGQRPQEIRERKGGWTIKITFPGDNLFINKMLYKIKNSLGPA